MSDLDVEIHSYFQNRIRTAHPRVTRVNRYSMPHAFGIECYDAEDRCEGMQFSRGYWEIKADVIAESRILVRDGQPMVSERDRLYILADLIFHEVHQHLLSKGW